MSQQEKLWTLVHRLDGNERRYFRLRSQSQQRQKTPNYLLLFDCLVDLSVYDEGQLEQMLAKKGFQGNLPVEKSYLKKQILRAMRSYGAENKVKLQIKNLIADGTFLFEKTLFSESSRIFAKAKKLAEQQEDFAALIEIGIWERRFVKHLERQGREARIEEILREQEGNLRRLNQLIRVHHCYDRLFVSAVKGELGEEVGIGQEEIQCLEIGEGASFRARQLALQVQALRHQNRKDWTSARDKYREILDLWDRYPEIREEELRRYSSLVSNFLHACTQTGDHASIPATLEGLKSLEAQSESESLLLEQVQVHYRLLWMLNVGELGEALCLETAKWLEAHKAQLPLSTVYTFLLNLSIIHFLAGRWRSSLKLLHEIQETRSPEVRRDLQDFARLLELILHYQLDNWELLPYLLRSQSRKYSRSEPAPLLEQAVYTFIRQSLKAAHLQEQLKALRDFEESLDLQALREARPGVMELSYWVKARLQGKELPDFVRLQTKELRSKVQSD